MLTMLSCHLLTLTLVGNSSCGLVGRGVGGEKGAEERIAENGSMAHRRVGCFSLRAKIHLLRARAPLPGLVVMD